MKGAGTLTAKILQAHQRAPARPGSRFFRAEVDLVLGHDATIALIIDRLKASGRPIRHPERCLFAADHFVPPASAERAEILHDYIAFVRESGIDPSHLFQGISHQLMLEDARCLPGVLICGADSHTTMAGALGAFAAGFGSTDILAILLTGEAIVRVPEAFRIDVHHRLPPFTLPKDVALHMMSVFGEDGATWRALEFVDHGRGLTVPARATISNMAVDCGAKNAIWIPDDETSAFLRRRDGGVRVDLASFRPDDDADYSRTLHFDLAEMEPMIARPGSPADVVPLRGMEGEAVDQVVLGSCTSSDGEDIVRAARALRGRRVAPGVRVVVTPASARVYRSLLDRGALRDLSEAGAIITAPSCGACGGIDKGLLGAGEVCISTSNRNFRGRMGHPDARVYLGSGLSAAAAALTGRIIDPREVFA